MTQGVIDVLEVVHVQEHHGKQRIGALGLGHGLQQAVAKQRPVGQAGEHVEMGQILCL